jgi:hypothetical protein
MRQAMRLTSHPAGRFLGYVQVKVASRVYSLPVEAAPLQRDRERHDDRALKPGFFAEAADRFGILVDSDAPDREQRATIERASADAALHISHRLLD